MNKTIFKGALATLILVDLFVTFQLNLNAQVIPQYTYVIQNVSRDNNNHPGAHAFDADSTTRRALFNSAGFYLAGYIEIDLNTHWI